MTRPSTCSAYLREPLSLGQQRVVQNVVQLAVSEAVKMQSRGATSGTMYTHDRLGLALSRILGRMELLIQQGDRIKVRQGSCGNSPSEEQSTESSSCVEVTKSACRI